MKTKLSSLLTITLLVLTTFATQARADGLSDIIERDFSPRATYCNYYWGEPVNTDEIPSMGAMVSGCSLMENMARLALALLPPTATHIATLPSADSDACQNQNQPSAIYDLSGRKVESAQAKGIQIVNGKKKIVR